MKFYLYYKMEGTPSLKSSKLFLLLKTALLTWIIVAILLCKLFRIIGLDVLSDNQILNVIKKTFFSHK